MQPEAKTTVNPTAGDSVLVLSYWNLNAPSFGGARRIRALLDCLGDRALLVQPAPAKKSKKRFISILLYVAICVTH